MPIAEALEIEDPGDIEHPLAAAFRRFADSTGADRFALAANQRSRQGETTNVAAISVPTLVLAGDAAGTVNPFNGEGIAYGWETGHLAADTIAAALRCSSEAEAAATLAAYEARLAEEYARYYAIAKAFVRVIEEPKIMRALVAAGMYVPPVMKGVLRIMANLNRPDRHVGSEALYNTLVKVSEAHDRRLGRTAPAGWPQD